MKFIIKYIRPIWSFLIGIPYHVWCMMLYLFVPLRRAEYYVRRKLLTHVTSVQELSLIFHQYYKYNWDGPHGFFDHTSTLFEFCMRWGDCEDVAYIVRSIIQRLYPNYDTDIIFFYSLKEGFAHFDCIFSMRPAKEWELYAFNYGHTIKFMTFKQLAETVRVMYGLNEISYFLLKGKDGR